MEWWHWLLIVLLLIVVFALWSGRAKGEHGNEDDFSVSAEPFIKRAKEYHRIALEDSPNDVAKLEKIQGRIDWELKQFQSWAKRSGVENTQTAINGAELIQGLKDDVRYRVSQAKQAVSSWR